MKRRSASRAPRTYARTHDHALRTPTSSDSCVAGNADAHAYIVFALHANSRTRTIDGLPRLTVDRENTRTKPNRVGGGEFPQVPETPTFEESKFRPLQPAHLSPCPRVHLFLYLLPASRPPLFFLFLSLSLLPAIYLLPACARTHDPWRLAPFDCHQRFTADVDSTC